jgi:pectin methylesterase-like acyl-CoA thioesterase
MTLKRVMTFVAVAAATLGAGGISAHASGQFTGSTLYVSTTGLDTSPCTQSQPCATLQHAVDAALAGDIVRVLPGTYNQTVNITKPLSLIGSGETSTIIDGSNIDTGAGLGTQDPTAPSSTPYFGVVSVQNNNGPGGTVRIRALGIDHAFVTALESSQADDPSDLSIYADANASDIIAVTEVTLGAVQDPGDFGGIGLDVFNAEG